MTSQNEYYVLYASFLGEDGPEERYIGPFSSEEDLLTFVNYYDLETDFYVKLFHPDDYVEEFVTVH